FRLPSEHVGLCAPLSRNLKAILSWKPPSVCTSNMLSCRRRSSRPAWIATGQRHSKCRLRPPYALFGRLWARPLNDQSSAPSTSAIRLGECSSLQQGRERPKERAYTPQCKPNET